MFAFLPSFLLRALPERHGWLRIAPGLQNLQVFYATIGASANVALVVRTAPVLFLFSALALGTHLLLMLGIGRMLGFSRKDLLIASNANIGGKSGPMPGVRVMASCD